MKGGYQVNLALLKMKRKSLGMTQSDVASVFQYTRQNYSAKEKGVQNFKLSEIKRLKELFDLTDHEVVEIFL